MKRTLICFLFVVLIFAGCASTNKPEERPADVLAKQGMDYFKDGKYRKSIQTFERLKDWYPFSKFAILAELKIADAYFVLEEFDNAILAYDQFESLHPRNEATPFVIYRIGLSYFNQMDTIDRDQTAARNAVDTFERLIMLYPDNPYSEKAKGHLKICQKNLAGHEFYVGYFYFKTKKYKTALSRFKNVLSDYPDVGYHKKALQYYAYCQSKVAEAESAE